MTWLDRDWHERAACRGVDPEVFFPVSDADAADAKAICRECVVLDACLVSALRGGERFGVWGGTSEEERKAMRYRSVMEELRASTG